MANVDNKAIYFTGGYDEFNWRTRKSCLRFGLEDEKWTYVADMNEARDSHSACSVNGFIYVFGGRAEKSSD